MVAEVETRTTDVLTRNVALVAPAGISTLEGTLAALLLLESETSAPPVGAGPFKITVPVEDCTPQTTLEGFSASELSFGSCGVTVSDAACPKRLQTWASEPWSDSCVMNLYAASTNASSVSSPLKLACRSSFVALRLERQ
jgi:hypothetical protein